MKKKLLSLLLVLLMLASILPASALAANKTFGDFFAGLPLIAETEPGSPNSTKKWKVTTLDGEDVLMSGNNGKSSSSSTLQLTMTADTNLSFEYKVSTEKNYDKLTITQGSKTLVNGVSGVIDWTRLEIDAKNDDVITIVYKKDSSGNKNDDCVYIRSFAAGAPTIITLHANNGTDETATQNIYCGKGVLNANTFTCEGKLFAGWATSADGEIVYADKATIETEEAMDLYAVWADAVTVTFNYNYGTTKDKTVAIAKGTQIGATNIPDAVKRTGYTFVGWFNDDGTQLTAETIINEDITYTGKWAPITYTIAFDADGGEGSMDSISATYDQEVTIPLAEGRFTRTGYTFSGWSTYKGYMTPTVQDGGTVKNLTNVQDKVITLYVTWKGNPVNITVNYNYDGAESITRVGMVGSHYNYVRQDDGKYKQDSLPDPVRTGWIFLGWYDAPEGGNEVTPSNKKFTAEDAENGFIMYAHWEKGITVHFDGNGYTQTINDKTVVPGKVYTNLPYLAERYMPTDKRLESWYIKLDGEGDARFGAAVTKDTDFSTMGDEVTLIAKWRGYQYIIKYNIKYSDKSSVTGTMADQPAPFGENVKLNSCAYSRPGYDFAGWATSSYGSTIAYADGATIKRDWEEDDWGDGSEDNEPFNLYAVWTEAKSEEEKEADAKLTAAEKAISGTYLPTYGKDANALTMIQAKLTAAGITDVAVSVKAGAKDNYSSYNYVGVADDGTLIYKWNENGSTSSATGYVRPVFVLTYKTYTKETTACNFGMGLDEVKAKAALNAVADRITVPETVESAEDLTKLPKYPVKAGVDESKVDYNKSDDIELWTTATWQSSSTNIAISDVGYPPFSPYKVAVSIPNNDAPVTLTLKLTYNGREDLYVSRVYNITLKGGVVEKDVDYQELLNKMLETEDALTNPRNDSNIDKANVASDIQFFTTKDLSALSMQLYNKGFDGKYTPIKITSSNEDVISSTDVYNAARVLTYRPLPGREAKSVTITIQILDRPSGEGEATDVLASAAIEVTVQPLTQNDLDTAAAFMKKVCTEEVYWDGIKKANSAKDNITGDMWSFIEIVPDGDGYKFIRTADDAKGVGVKADSIDGWYASEKYRCFRSSKDTVIKHENLLLTQPQYNTSVKIDSVLSYSEYSKYYEKFKNNADYAQFAKFYKQPISIVVKVIGTEGIDNPNTETISVTVNMDGNAIDKTFTDFNYTYTCNSADYKTGMDAVVAAITESGYTYTGNGSYLNSVTSPDGVTLGLADEKYGPWSGWMFTVNGSSPMLDETTQARLDQYILKKGDIIRFYYVECPTETRHHIRGTGDKTKCSVCGKVMPLLYGDVNGDGEVTSTDAGIVILYLKGKTELTAEQLLAADVNGDGQVTSSDAGNIILYCKGKISSFPASAN